MGIFRKLKRTWSHGYLNYIPKFKEQFPELNMVSSEELADRFIKLNLNFYTEEKCYGPWWIRLTLPFALILFVLLTLSMPIKFILTGEWRYSMKSKFMLRVVNWFRSLGLD